MKVPSTEEISFNVSLLFHKSNNVCNGCHIYLKKKKNFLFYQLQEDEEERGEYSDVARYGIIEIAGMYYFFYSFNPVDSSY